MLTQESLTEIARLQKEYPDPQSALLGALALAQQDYGGWLPDRALDEVAGALGLPATLVASTVSFYTMLQHRPVGRHVIQVCRSISCFLVDGDRLADYIGQKLGIEPGETTPDGAFTLLEVECLGSCGTAPVLQVGERLYENVTRDTVDEILAGMAT